MSNCPTFIKGKNVIMQVLCGAQGDVLTALGSDFVVMDASMADGAGEKHVPVVEQNGNQIRVQIGSVLHPMTDEHSINWVYLETQKGGQLVNLEANGEPVANFVVAEGDKAVKAYAYCNLHGFWETPIS